MLKKILLGILALLVVGIGVVFAIAATKSDDFSVRRATTIQAPPADVYAVMSNMHRFPEWSPWQHLDPHMTTTFSGPESGNGAGYSWTGNDDVGEGSMTISRTQPGSLIGVHLVFLKPWQATNEVEWRIAPEGAGSRVEWVMTGKQNFMMKAFTVFMDMDAVVGRDFAAGLANLKRLVESGAH